MTEKPENQIDNTTRSRLAGQTMQPATTPRCWYCWAITPWWDCNCPDATLAREGKLAKPRVVEDPATGLPVIILPEHVVERHAAAGRIWDNGSRLERWRDVHEIKPPVNKPANLEPANTDVNSKPREHTVHTPAVNSREQAKMDAAAAEKRKAYRREWMARKRQK
jgi:hypothetical protein